MIRLRQVDIAARLQRLTCLLAGATYLLTELLGPLAFAAGVLCACALYAPARAGGKALSYGMSQAWLASRNEACKAFIAAAPRKSVALTGGASSRRLELVAYVVACTACILALEQPPSFRWVAARALVVGLVLWGVAFGFRRRTEVVFGIDGVRLPGGRYLPYGDIAASELCSPERREAGWRVLLQVGDEEPVSASFEEGTLLRSVLRHELTESKLRAPIAASADYRALPAGMLRHRLPLATTSQQLATIESIPAEEALKLEAGSADAELVEILAGRRRRDAR